MSSLLTVTKDLIKTTEQVKEELKKVFQKPNEYTHQDRWEHFLAFYKLGGRTKHSIYYGWDEFYNDDISWYDDFNCDRYQTLDLVAAINEDEGILTSDELDLVKDCTNEQFRYVLDNHPKTVAMREALMRDDITHMVMDW